MSRLKPPLSLSSFVRRRNPRSGLCSALTQRNPCSLSLRKIVLMVSFIQVSNSQVTCSIQNSLSMICSRILGWLWPETSKTIAASLESRRRFSGFQAIGALGCSEAASHPGSRYQYSLVKLVGNSSVSHLLCRSPRQVTGFLASSLWISTVLQTFWPKRCG